MTEWKALQEGITGAGMFVALVDRGFFDSFKEANALAHHLREAHERSDSVLSATSQPDTIDRSG